MINSAFARIVAVFAVDVLAKVKQPGEVDMELTESVPEE